VFKLLERTSCSYMPLWGHTRDNVIMLDDGSQFAMVEVMGCPWETEDARDVVDKNLRWNHTLKNIASPNLIIMVYQCRGLADHGIYPAGKFRSDFAASLDAAYRGKLFEQSLYENRTFIGLQLRPERYAGETVSEHLALHQKPVDDPDEERIQRLEEVMALLMAELKAYRPRRLGVRTRGYCVFSEIAEAIVLAMTGTWRPIPLTTGKLGEAMFSEHIVIDREFIKYLMPGKVWYGAAFGMKHFPAWTWPGMFATLLATPYTNTVFHYFRFIPTATAQGIMKRKTYRMLTAEDPAESQALALKRAADELGSSDYVFGDYSFTFLVFARSLKALDDIATAAWGNLADSGMVVAREMAGLEAALFSMVPGNARLRPRPGYLSSRNLTAMAPLHAYPTGAKRGYWGEPVAIFRTGGGVAYSFHLQVGDVGNAFLCGRTGSGKTTWMAFIVCQSERLGATVILFDKDRCLKILVNALGGIYLELDNPTGLAPLKALTDSEEDIGFLAALVRGCIMAGNNLPLTEEENRRLHLGLQTVMALPPVDRSLAEVRAFLGREPECAGIRLEKWCRGNEFGWIIDNEADLISLDAPVLGFDQTKILDNEWARGPVMATLYHYMDKLIDGRRLLFIIDEFWKSLKDESFRELVNDKLRTLRKQNSPMILATQSPREGLDSTLRTVIKDQCPTQIYFMNSRAEDVDYGEQGMGLTAKEIDIVRSLKVGEFLLKQDTVSVPAQLMLDGLDDHIAVLSARKSTLGVFDRIRRDSHADITETLRLFHEARVTEFAG
jgi:type IV secretion system protein VirB4